ARARDLGIAAHRAARPQLSHHLRRAAVGPADGRRGDLVGAADDPLLRGPALHVARHDRRLGEGLTPEPAKPTGRQDMNIRIAVGQFHELTDERLRFAVQIGATGLQMNNPTLPGESRWEEADVRKLVEKTETYGLKFEAIENVPTHFYD